LPERLAAAPDTTSASRVRDDYKMTLYPHLANRIGTGAAPAVLAFFAAWELAQRGMPAWLLAAILVVGAILGVRGYRMGVTCTDSALVVRGMFLTRTISRSAITSVHEEARTIPRVMWRAENGKSRWVLLLAFAVNKEELPFTRRLKVSQLSKIMTWYAAGRQS